MKKFIKPLCYAVIVLLVLCIPYLSWVTKKTVYLNTVILDKTVPVADYREHKGLMWVMNNLKYFDSKIKTPFDYRKDYFGFFPLTNEKYETKELPEDLGVVDFAYITDTYGVYTDDFYKKNQRGDRSNLIYGGTKLTEIEKLKNACKIGTIVGEFNTLASPTDSGTKKQMEELFGISWSGWIGRYFDDLSKENIEIPNWLIKDYELQYEKWWEFKGPGLVFVSADDKVVVLRSGAEIGPKLNTIHFTDNALKEFDVKNNVKYYYWFEILNASPNTEVLARYNLDVTDEGKRLLNKFGIEESFPAVVRRKAQNTIYYFAGDFADSNNIPVTYKARGLYFLNKITSLDIKGNQQYFYWKVYYPLMEKILTSVNTENKVE